MSIYSEITSAKTRRQKLLAILIDPDKVDWDSLEFVAEKICDSPATHVLIGGSHVASQRLDELVIEIKQRCGLPVVLFPGNPSQISPYAHGILFLSLLSGRNPEFLVGHHVRAARTLKQSDLEVIPTGYLLIESGSVTAVEFVSNTSPLSVANINNIIDTAIASELMGHRLVYLEAGSGAANPVPSEIIAGVSKNISIPLIVGGGIKDLNGIEAAYSAGADMVVIGNAFESNPNFFN